MSVRKQFDADLFEKNDTPARNAVLRYLDSQGSYVVNNPDQYGPDLILYRGLKELAYIECEIKSHWSGPKFPFSTIQLPYRKQKFISAGLPIEFWILNKELTHAVIIPDYVLDSSFLALVPNRYVSEGEMFWQIPIELCMTRDLSIE